MAAQSDGGGDAARALDALRRIVRALRVSSRAVERDVGISGAQLFVLRQLAAAPRQSLNDLVARTLTHQSSVSEVVSRLVDRGFVSRRVAADDARRAELQLTAKGRALLRSAPQTVQTSLLDGFARLSTAHRRALADGLAAWIEASGLAGIEPTMFFESPRARTGAAAAPASPRADRQRGSSVQRTPSRRSRRVDG
ncbi:MAG TPA: MarR family transcriptional regulator [Gemmatimonadaceae bacterium]|nr:MarR family transcriptional regulator [Gemmatimonadaceae bacterium]